MLYSKNHHLRKTLSKKKSPKSFSIVASCSGRVWRSCLSKTLFSVSAFTGFKFWNIIFAIQWFLMDDNIVYNKKTFWFLFLQHRIAVFAVARLVTMVLTVVSPDVKITPVKMAANVSCEKGLSSSVIVLLDWQANSASRHAPQVGVVFFMEISFFVLTVYTFL